MNKFTKWFITSILFALIGLIVVLNVEEWARLSGELSRSIILIGTISTFVLVLISLYCLLKASGERKKNHIIISLFSSLVPLSVFVMNGLVFTVYFIGK